MKLLHVFNWWATRIGGQKKGKLMVLVLLPVPDINAASVPVGDMGAVVVQEEANMEAHKVLLQCMVKQQ